MSRAGSAIVILAFALPLAAAPVPKADASKSWVGKKVIVKDHDVVMKVLAADGAEVEEVLVEYLDPVVIAEKPDRVEIYAGGKVGWVAKADVFRGEDGIEFFTKQLAEEETADRLVRRSACYNLAGKIDQAIEDMDRAIQIQPDGATYQNRGALWVTKGDLDKALTDYDEAVRVAPDDVFSYRGRGHARLQAHKYDAALEDLNKALEMEADAWTHGDAGLAWAGKGEHKKAIAEYDKALELNPKHAIALVRRGDARVRLADLTAAVKDYDKAIALYPADPDARLGRARALYKQAKPVAAAGDIQEVLRLDPKNAAALNLRAWYLAVGPDAAHRDGQKAVDLATKACELTDWKVAAYLDTLAAAYAEAGRWDDAVKWQEKALADAELAKDDGPAMTQRLALFKEKKPYREEEKK
jgi:tetratricopeptide (TPR) repeat protein